MRCRKKLAFHPLNLSGQETVTKTAKEMLVICSRNQIRDGGGAKEECFLNDLGCDPLHIPSQIAKTVFDHSRVPKFVAFGQLCKAFFPQQYTVSKQIVACRNCLKYPLTKACLFASIPVNLEGFCCSAVKQICPLSSPRETAICARNRTNVLCSERTNVLCSQLCSIT